MENKLSNIEKDVLQTLLNDESYLKDGAEGWEWRTDSEGSRN